MRIDAFHRFVFASTATVNCSLNTRLPVMSVPMLSIAKGVLPYLPMISNSTAGDGGGCCTAGDGAKRLLGAAPADELVAGYSDCRTSETAHRTKQKKATASRGRMGRHCPKSVVNANHAVATTAPMIWSASARERAAPVKDRLSQLLWATHAVSSPHSSGTPIAHPCRAWNGTAPTSQ